MTSRTSDTAGGTDMRPTVVTPDSLSTLPADADAVANVLVIGAGQMGSGIAQVFAVGGRHVWLTDVDHLMLERAKRGIASSVERLHGKNLLTDEQVTWSQDRIQYVTDVSTVQGIDIHLSVEAITEYEPVKLDTFRMLDELLVPGAILASNTSSIPITRLGSATKRPDRVIGMHFMNPVPMLDLVEIIPGMATSREVVTLISDLARSIGKTAVESSDSPGFITNRILMPLINEAFCCLHEGVGTPDAIDAAMRLGMRHPLGPLALADLIGLDTCLAILEVLHRDLGDDRYRPSPLLRRYVDAGRFGRKSGAGVYEYTR